VIEYVIDTANELLDDGRLSQNKHPSTVYDT